MNRDLVGAIATLIALGFAPLMVQAAEGKPRRIIDPYAEEQFSCVGKPDGRFHNNPNESFGYNGFRIRADLNFDGLEDLILTTVGVDDGGCGNAGCSATAYLQQSDKTYVSVPFFLHPLAAGSERIRRGQGTLVTYHHMSADDGALGSFRVTASSITLIASVDLHVKDSTADEDLYNHWFHEGLALHAEYSSCVAGQLRWSDSYK